MVPIGPGSPLLSRKEVRAGECEFTPVLQHTPAMRVSSSTRCVCGFPASHRYNSASSSSTHVHTCTPCRHLGIHTWTHRRAPFGTSGVYSQRPPYFEGFVLHRGNWGTGRVGHLMSSLGGPIWGSLPQASGGSHPWFSSHWNLASPMTLHHEAPIASSGPCIPPSHAAPTQASCSLD